MSADERSVRNSLAAAQHAQIDRICTAFEVAWRRGQTPNMEDSLRGLDGPQPVRELLFAELLELEVHYRRSRHQLPSAADYQARFPEYGEQIARVFQKPPAASKTAPVGPARESPSVPPPEWPSRGAWRDVGAKFQTARREFSFRGVGSGPGCCPAWVRV